MTFLDELSIYDTVLTLPGNSLINSLGGLSFSPESCIYERTVVMTLVGRVSSV